MQKIKMILAAVMLGAFFVPSFSLANADLDAATQALSTAEKNMKDTQAAWEKAANDDKAAAYKKATDAQKEYKSAKSTVEGITSAISNGGGDLTSEYAAEQAAAQSVKSSTTGECKDNVCVKLSTPFGKTEEIGANSGTELLQKYASYIYKYIVGICGLVGVLIMVVSGVQMMTAGVDEGAYGEAKERILRTLGGMALLFGMAVLLNMVNPIYFTL